MEKIMIAIFFDNIIMLRFDKTKAAKRVMVQRNQ